MIHPVDRWLGPGGLLAQLLPGYESREAQLQFAHDVSRTLDEGGILLAEAPTGVGKSLGYLVPALLWSRAQREPVVVSTHTKQLQSQLTDVDLPLVAGALDPPPRVVRLKGKANYVCPRRWRLHVAEHKKRGGRAGAADRAVAEWLGTTATGDLDELDLSARPGGAALRARIACEPTFCNAQACPPGGDCPWRKARRQAGSAELVVVNHALLVSGIGATGVLPPFRALVVDEGHHLDPVLTSQWTVRQSLSRLETTLEAFAGSGGARGGGSLLTLVAATLEGRLSAPHAAALAEHLGALAGAASPLREAAREFFAQVTAGLAADPAAADPNGYEPRARFRSMEDLVGRRYDALEHLLLTGQDVGQRLRAVLDLVGRTGPGAGPGLDELSGDLAGAVGTVDEWLAAMRFLTDPREGEYVYWRSGARAESAELAGAPVEVARRLRETFLPGITGLVLASATLTTGGSFRYVRDRLGLDEDAGFGITERVYPSPFDFPRQLAAFVVTGAEAGAPVPLLARLARRLRRNMLVLFTSHRALRTAARGLAAALADEGLPVWAQEVDGTAVELARRFREARGAVLLGTASFWEGVDFPGEALEVLVLERLPFPVPTDPLIEARCERVEAAGESGFARVMVPEAILRFRQGIGRLVRRRSDRGVVVLLDPRIVAKGYGQLFQRGLPVPLRAAQGGDDLEAQAEAFLAGDVRRDKGAA